MFNETFKKRSKVCHLQLIALLIKHFDHILSSNAASISRQDCIANLKQEIVCEITSILSPFSHVFLSFFEINITLVRHIMVLFL